MPKIVIVPRQSYIMIGGKGNPNNADFSDRVAALFSLAYSIKMGHKSVSVHADLTTLVHDFSVYPLEGVWKYTSDTECIKDNLEYTTMIRQPDCITEEMVRTALEKVKKKKPTPLLDEIYFDTAQDGKCIEILHAGSFDDEPASFEKMDIFAKQNGFERITNYPREIYLNNAKRVLESKLQTILRYQVT